MTINIGMVAYVATVVIQTMTCEALIEFSRSFKIDFLKIIICVYFSYSEHIIFIAVSLCVYLLLSSFLA